MEPVLASIVHVSQDKATEPPTLLIRTANNFWTRFRGLMLTCQLNERHGLLLMHCNSIHTFFMRYPLDIVYLNANGRITQCISHVKPWRVCFSHRNPQHGRTRHTLELTAGTIEKLEIIVGDQFVHPLFCYSTNPQSHPS